MKNCIAIIPARGGSKRIPKKNIKDFLGKPIIAYTIENCLSAGLFSKVIVSTDSQEIADIAVSYGAEVPFLRSTENSSDTASTMDVIAEVCRDIEAKYICCVYPFSVFADEVKLKESFSLLKSKKTKAVFSCVEYSHPVQRGFSLSSEGVSFSSPKSLPQRTQDLEPHYHDAGLLYWLDLDSFNLTKDSILSVESAPYVVDTMSCQDIDTMADWQLAELKYKIQSRGSNE